MGGVSDAPSGLLHLLVRRTAGDRPRRGLGSCRIGGRERPGVPGRHARLVLRNPRADALRRGPRGAERQGRTRPCRERAAPQEPQHSGERYRRRTEHRRRPARQERRDARPHQGSHVCRDEQGLRVVWRERAQLLGCRPSGPALELQRTRGVVPLHVVSRRGCRGG